MISKFITFLSICATPVLGHAQTILFQEDFGTSSQFTLNTTDAGSQTSGANTWLINNVYAGGSGEVVCSGFPLPFTIPATPSQPAGISNANGNYLHIASTAAIASGVLCSSFAAADGFCTDPGNHFARMDTDVNTSGYSTAELSFWWLCNGGTQNYGEVYYSIDGGTSWALISTPIAQYRNQPTWIQQTISLPVFAGQNMLRFGFRFVNNISLTGGSDPAFAIDDLVITGSQASSSLSTGSVPLAFCASGGPVTIPFTATGQFDPGNVFTAELSDATGGFASPTILGSIAGTTSGSITGTIPSGLPPGNGYRVRVISSSPAINGQDNGADITIDTVPNAGTSAVLLVCANDAPVNLFGLLGGSPDAGGSWQDPAMLPFGGIFDPASDPEGCYTYMVDGGACDDVSSTLCVSLAQPPYAGQEYTGPLCSYGLPIPGLPYLGPGVQPNGLWMSPNGQPWDGTFEPGIDPIGCYTYTALGLPPCANDMAVLCITGVVDGVDPGTDSTVTVCILEGSYDLNEGIGGTPDPGGEWADDGGNVIAGGVVTLDDYGIGEFSFTYTLEVDPPCEGTSMVTLDIVPCLSVDVQNAPRTVTLQDLGHGNYVLRSAEPMQELRVMDVTGRIILTKNVPGDDHVYLELDGFATTVLLIEITTSTGRHSLRVARQ